MSWSFDEPRDYPWDNPPTRAEAEADENAPPNWQPWHREKPPGQPRAPWPEHVCVCGHLESAHKYKVPEDSPDTPPEFCMEDCCPCEMFWMDTEDYEGFPETNLREVYWLVPIQALTLPSEVYVITAEEKGV